MISDQIRIAPAVLMLAVAGSGQAQVVSGIFERPIPANHVVLYGTRGSDHYAMDSVPIGFNGHFRFSDRKFPSGFYQLGINDTDRVDVILDPREPALELAFHGRPLQRNVSIVASSENQRMWAYKGYSRAGQEAINAIRAERALGSPLDTAFLRRSAILEEQALRTMEHMLDSLIGIAPEGQFAYAVALDRRLDDAALNGPSDILKAMDFSDQRNLRSSSFSKALMVYLRSIPLSSEFALHRACDTLLVAAQGDPACWSYTRSHLIELFATYGPDEVAQYLVDTYVVGSGARFAPDAALLTLAAEQMRMVIGAPAPDIALAKPGDPDTLLLSRITPEHDLTALFFYSSTCDHCHDQMPGLRQLVLDMEPRHFQLIGIALDTDAAEFATTLVEKGINWPCFTDLKGWGAKAAQDFAVKATPQLIVVDRQGRIAAKPMDHQELRNFLVGEQRR